MSPALPEDKLALYKSQVLVSFLSCWIMPAFVPQILWFNVMSASNRCRNVPVLESLHTPSSSFFHSALLLGM